MTERDEILRNLEEASIPEALRWAYRSAARQVHEEYSEESGHDAGWVGYTRFVLLRDRLNRVFSCGRYALAADALPEQGRDVVMATLPQAEMDTMPVIDANLVASSNLNHSIGWSFGEVRWLLASAPFRKLNTIRWETKSRTKRLVAQQRHINPDQGSLFDELGDAELPASLEVASLPDIADLDKLTLVLAHSQDPLSWQGEIGIGMPRLSHGQGSAWTWFEDLLTAPPSQGGSRVIVPAGPLNDGHLNEPDAVVKLRDKKTAIQPPSAEQR